MPNKWVICATGYSLSDKDIAVVRELRAKETIQGIIAVSNAGIDKLPDADALVSHDSAWWIAYPDSLNFAGKKYSARGFRRTIPYEVRVNGYVKGVNSGLMAMYIARDIYKASHLILLGFDMNRDGGQHYFGKHEKVLNGKQLINTDEKKFDMHIKQFNEFRGCEVVNCSINSSLKQFPILPLCDIVKIWNL